MITAEWNGNTLLIKDGEEKVFMGTVTTEKSNAFLTVCTTNGTYTEFGIRTMIRKAFNTGFNVQYALSGGEGADEMRRLGFTECENGALCHTGDITGDCAK